MENINQLLVELRSRLPELEWKITNLNQAFSAHHLPRELFPSTPDWHAKDCIINIKRDIQQLSSQKTQTSAYYLAQRIKQKISVLVRLCQLDKVEKKTKDKLYFGVKSLSTRQQRVSELEVEINMLLTQREALADTLSHLKKEKAPTIVIRVSAELGEVEKRITIAQEILKKLTA